MSDCVLGRYCSKHGFVHGAEAEQLREAMEEALEECDAESEAADRGDVTLAEAGEIVRAFETLTKKLRRALDTIDARDAAAYLECRQEEAQREGDA